LLKRLRDVLRQQLRLACAGSQTVLGGVGGEEDAAHGLWRPRFHLIAPAALAPPLGGLRRRFYPRIIRITRGRSHQGSGPPDGDPTLTVSP
jgi:hypothetical protein